MCESVGLGTVAALAGVGTWQAICPVLSVMGCAVQLSSAQQIQHGTVLQGKICKTQGKRREEKKGRRREERGERLPPAARYHYGTRYR